jgi:hypothetical protein
MSNTDDGTRIGILPRADRWLADAQALSFTPPHPLQIDN